MNCKHFILFSLFVPFVVQSMDNKPSYMHIKNLSTIILFNKEEKSVFELIRDGKDGAFGQMPVYREVTNSEDDRLFKKERTIQTINKKRLESITSGYSIYYKNIIKSEHNPQGNAIVCCNSRYVDDKFMQELENKLQFHILKNLYHWKKKDTGCAEAINLLKNF
jgi:hypothetical protein